jgi:capsular polysaccharide transport system permease protein
MSDNSGKPHALVVRLGRALSRRSRELAEPGEPPSSPALHQPLPAWPAAAQHAQILLDMRRVRRRRLLLRLALFVGLPTVLTLFYTLLWATPRYVTEVEITYQEYRPVQSLSSGLLQSVAGTSQNSSIDIGALLYEYIRSPALLAKLDTELGLRNYYSSSKIDFFSRMSPTASREKFLRYYLWYVSVSQGLGGYLTIEVQAFDPKFAVALASAVVKACDQMVDQMTSRSRQDEMRFAQEELVREEDRVRKARKGLTDFQNKHGDLDPQRVATQLGQIAGTIEGELATARTELANDLAYMQPNSLPVVALKYKITALENQLKAEQTRLASSDGKAGYSQILDEYSALQLEQEFAKNAYLSAQQGLAVARADAARQRNYLIDFAPPSEPDAATAYFPLVYTLTAFVGSLLIFGIGSLMAAAFRDQTGL